MKREIKTKPRKDEEEGNNKPGSGPLGAVAQTSWLGQPWHASDLPAESDWGPGQSERETKKKIN